MENYTKKDRILARIDEYEKSGQFDKDIEDDPPFSELKPDEVDFLNRRFINRIKRRIANFFGKRFYENLMKTEQVIFEGVTGLENLQELNSGAIVTCNHCHIFDNYAVLLGLKKHFKKMTLYKVIREGNYSLPGRIGFFLRYCDTLPLSSNVGTMTKLMHAIKALLLRKKLILIYPEQGMWHNYTKPRPVKDGAFRIAARFSVPVLPCFLTLKQTDNIDANGFNVQRFTLNILPLIYPDPNKSELENSAIMKEKNFLLWKQTYESVYNVPLEYLQN